MNDPQIAVPSRAPAAEAVDDTILPFAVKALDLRGRIVDAVENLDGRPLSELMVLLAKVRPVATYPTSHPGIQ